MTGRKPGTTAIVVVDDNGRSVAIDVVVEPDLALLQRHLKLAFPALDIAVTPLNDTISVRGQVPSMQIAEQVVEWRPLLRQGAQLSGNRRWPAGDAAGPLRRSFQDRPAASLGVTFGGTDNRFRLHHQRSCRRCQYLPISTGRRRLSRSWRRGRQHLRYRTTTAPQASTTSSQPCEPTAFCAIWPNPTCWRSADKPPASWQVEKWRSPFPSPVTAVPPLPSNTSSLVCS